MNASGGSEAAIAATTRIGWIKFREYGELLYGKKFSSKIKGRIYQRCVRSAMLYRSKTCYLRENEMAILKRMSQELMSLLGLKDTLNGLARANGAQWYGHVLRRDSGDV